MVDARRTDVVVVWAIDRLVRRLADLENVIERCERAGVKLATVSGDLDLSTDQGRLVGRILASVARGEVERKGTRQRLAAQQAAAHGERRRGCPRPFGYADDHVTPHPAEGPAVADACRALLAGGTLSGVMREWTAAGVRPPQGSERWTRQSIRSILLSPGIAGLASYKGEITGPGTWQALVPEETWRAVTAMLQDPGRKPPRGVRTLLGGLALCVCGAPAYGSVNHLGRHVYRCPPPLRPPGSGPHVARDAGQIDAYVSAVVVARLSRPDAADLLSTRARADVTALAAEANALRARAADLGAMFAAGDIGRAALLAGTERATRRLTEIDTQLAEAGRESAVAPLVAADDARKVWDTLDLSRKRAVIAALCTIRLLPPGKGRRRFDPASVDVQPVRAP